MKLDGSAGYHGAEPSDEYVEAYTRYHLKAYQDQSSTLKYLTDYLDHTTANGLLAPGSSLLYLGCGTGGYFHLLSHASEIVGVDFSQKMVDVAKDPPLKDRLPPGTRVTAICANWLQYEPGRTFDAVFASTLGTYLPIDRTAMRRVDGFLRPGGLIFLPLPRPRQTSQLKSLAKRLVSAVRKTSPLPITAWGERRRILQLATEVCQADLVAELATQTNVLLAFRKR